MKRPVDPRFGILDQRCAGEPFNDVHAGQIVLKSLHAGHIDDRRALFTTTPRNW
jgi:hypothetical protein